MQEESVDQTEQLREEVQKLRDQLTVSQQEIESLRARIASSELVPVGLHDGSPRTG